MAKKKKPTFKNLVKKTVETSPGSSQESRLIQMCMHMHTQHSITTQDQLSFMRVDVG